MRRQFRPSVGSVFDFLTGLVLWRLPRLLLRVAVYVMAGAALMIFFNFSTLQEYFRARERRDNYRESVAALQREYNQLLQEQAELKNNGFDKEKAIRERWLMVKPGEQILFIEPSMPSETMPPIPAVPDKP